VWSTHSSDNSRRIDLDYLTEWKQMIGLSWDDGRFSGLSGRDETDNEGADSRHHAFEKCIVLVTLGQNGSLIVKSDHRRSMQSNQLIEAPIALP
jgi:hypothetical protein